MGCGANSISVQANARRRYTESGGGWSRFVWTVDVLVSLVSKLKAGGVEFKNDIVDQGGRKQILCQDPSGNVVELFQGA